MKIALVQMDIKWESKEANHRNAEEFVEKASHEASDIVVFPEMFNTGFSMNVSAIAEDEHGETASVLSRMAKQYDINLIAGYVVKDFDGRKGRNIAVACNRNGEWISKYVKLYPFSYAGEDQYYIAGKDTAIFNIEGMTASMFICYDLRFPEAFRRVAKDVQAIFVLANWPSGRREHWEALLKARAIENQCFVIGVNRIGTDGNGIHYPGASHIYDPLGNDVCSGSETEEFLMGEFNPSEVVRIRSEYPFLKDMRSLEKCERSKPS